MELMRSRETVGVRILVSEAVRDLCMVFSTPVMWSMVTSENWRLRGPTFEIGGFDAYELTLYAFA